MVFRWAIVAAVVFLTGCTWKIIPPVVEGDGSPVFVTAYSKHTRIALPVEGERFIEYGFGDWRYYALEETGVRSALRAGFFSRSSALARRELPWTLDVETFRRTANGVFTVRIEVETCRARGLMEKLEALWEELDEERVFQSAHNLGLAKWDRRYHLFRNSNHQAAEWLEELGCGVRGWTMFNRFQLAAPQNP